MKFYTKQHQYYCGIDLHAKVSRTHKIFQKGAAPAIRCNRLVGRYTL